MSESIFEPSPIVQVKVISPVSSGSSAKEGGRHHHERCVSKELDENKVLRHAGCCGGLIECTARISVGNSDKYYATWHLTESIKKL